MKRELIGLACAVMMLGLAYHANATMIELDWHVTGDRSITLDDSSGLEWLDITETAGYSHNFIEDQLTPGGLYDGWRLATTKEIQDLYSAFGMTTAFGMTPYSSSNFETDVAKLVTMISYIGDNMSKYTGYTGGIWGTSADLAISDTTAHQILGAYYNNDDFPLDVYGEVNFRFDGSYSQPDNVSWHGAGAYLVRTAPVPEPATMLLMGSGLAVLIGARWKKKK